MQDEKLPSEVVGRGDSFDLGGENTEEIVPRDDMLTKIISNPQGLMRSLELDEKQAKNVAAVITGGAAGLGRKYLSDFMGPELAGAVSGFLGGYISKKLVGK